jgi:hypothetical protein
LIASVSSLSIPYIKKIAAECNPPGINNSFVDRPTECFAALPVARPSPNLRFLLSRAEKSRLRVVPLISNYPGRNATMVPTDIEDYRHVHMGHAAQHKLLGRPAVVIYGAQSLRERWQFLSTDVTFLASANGLSDFLGVFEDGSAGFLTHFPDEELNWCTNPAN